MGRIFQGGIHTERLTNDRTYFEVKNNAEGLQTLGLQPSVSDMIYIKLAEYERNEEKQQKTIDMLFAENTDLRLQLRRQMDQNNRLREALQRQSMDNYEYE